jgi:hypothetical protein
VEFGGSEVEVDFGSGCFPSLLVAAVEANCGFPSHEGPLYTLEEAKKRRYW